ncbi:unnamed protein product [Victoria cruziana]
MWTWVENLQNFEFSFSLFIAETVSRGNWSGIGVFLWESGIKYCVQDFAWLWNYLNAIFFAVIVRDLLVA